jgi:hypothetical protein
MPHPPSPNQPPRARLRLALVAVAAAVAATSGLAAAQSSEPPVNDDYLDSLQLNGPGTPLNRTDTLRDERDTTAATTQSDIFAPESSGGGKEVVHCKGTNYGATIWYDLYPDEDGRLRVRTSGFDNVITIYPFDPQTLRPKTDRKRCVNEETLPSEEMLVPVRGGKAYTIQIGGVDGVGGPLRVLFDYAVDKLRRLRADATLTAAAESDGITVRGLEVSTSRRTRVTVDCTRGCKPKSKRGSKKTRFPHLAGKRLRSGTKLQIRVTAPRAIGVYIEYEIRPGSFTKRTRCMNPGSRKPRRSCG